MTTTPASRTAILVPELGIGQDQLRISAWLVDVGNSIVAGDRIAEVLIPGIAFDIPAPQTGRLSEITRAIDAVVSPGEIIGWIVAES